MTPQEEQERLRYLQLKQKQAMGSSEAAPPESPWLEKRIGKKAYGIASGPKNTATGLLNMAADAMAPKQEVTNRPAMDALRNAPSILARSASKVLPEFVSPESMATAAIAPALGLAGKGVRAGVRPAGRWAATQAEEFMGMYPESLRTAFNNSKAIFAKGKGAASQLYEVGKKVPTTRAVPVGGVSELDDLRTLAKEATDHRTLFDAATKLEKAGALEPDVALSARKSMWQIKKSIPKDQFYEKLTKFNKIIKENAAMAAGDDVYKKGLMGESLRSLFPRSASGKPSVGKSVVGALSGMGAAFSPAALGAGSTVAGLAGRKLLSPIINAPLKPLVTATALLQARRKNGD